LKLKALGLVKTTLLDYPGKVAATLFTPGCNLRCPYCHNPGLVQDIDRSSLLPLAEIHAFLKKRAGVLGGVVITGGEPLLFNEDLRALSEYIHSLGLKVKLDTNGTFPGELSDFPADFIAMDLKTSPEKYSLMGYKQKDIIEKLKASITFIKNSGKEHQIRSTVHEDWITMDDAKDMAVLLKGVNQLRLTAFRPDVTLNPDFRKKKSPSSDYLNRLKDFFISCSIPTIVE